MFTLVAPSLGLIGEAMNGVVKSTAEPTCSRPRSVVV